MHRLISDQCAVSRSRALAVSLGLACSGLALSQSDPFPYRIVDLGPLGFSSDAQEIGTFDINERHQVAYGRVVGNDTRPHVWLPFDDATYHPSLAAGENDLLTKFPISGFSVGIAFDINDDGIVVGQVGGVERGVAGSRAAWWNLKTGTRGLILPPPGSGPGTDWTRAIAVSDSAPPSLLVETWVIDECRPDCENPPIPPGTPSQATFVTTTSVTLPTTAVGTVFSGLDCDPSFAGRDIFIGPSGPMLMGSSTSIELVDNCIRVVPLCESKTNAAVIDVAGGITLLQDADATLPPQTRGSEARAAAAGGAAVGWAFTDDGGSCRQGAAFWASTTSFVDLHAVSGLNNGSGTAFSVAEGISDDAGSLVVGWTSSGGLPYLWIADGPSLWTAYELDVFAAPPPPPDQPLVIASSCPGAAPEQAHDVTTDGWIVAVGFGPSGGDHTFVLVPARSGCDSDLDGDGDVDFDDLLLLLSAYGDPLAPCSFTPKDLDNDGVIGFSDLLTLLAGWCPDGQNLDGIPQTLQDCIDKYGFDPLALEACISTLPTP